MNQKRKYALNSGLDGKANTIHTHDDRYFTETESDNRYERRILHKDLTLTSGRDIYVYPARVEGYQLISAFTNNNACYVTRFSLGSSADTIVLSASPTTESTLYLVYVRYDY